MATVEDIEAMGWLIRQKVRQGGPELEYRRLYFTCLLQTWKTGWLDSYSNIKTQRSVWQRAQTPAADLLAASRMWLLDRVLIMGADYKCLSHLDRCVWELKFSEIRLIGIIPVGGTFVAVTAGVKSLHLRKAGYYRPHIETSLNFAKAMQLTMLDESNGRKVLG